MNIPTYLSGTVQAQAYRLLRVRVYEVLGQYDLNPTYWSVLGIIVEAQDGVRTSEISKMLHVKPPLVTMITRNLIERKLIRSVPHQFDGRAKLLAITPGGKRFVKKVEQSLKGILGNLLSGLTDDDLMTYHKVLSTIIANDNRLQKSH